MHHENLLVESDRKSDHAFQANHSQIGVMLLFVGTKSQKSNSNVTLLYILVKIDLKKSNQSCDIKKF